MYWYYKLKICNKIKDISISNHAYYFFNDIINMKRFNPNNIKIDKNSYKNILIYYIGYMTIKNSKYININRVNPSYLIINKMNGYIGEINENNCSMLVTTNGTKKKIKKIWRTMD